MKKRARICKITKKGIWKGLKGGKGRKKLSTHIIISEIKEIVQKSRMETLQHKNGNAVGCHMPQSYQIYTKMHVLKYQLCIPNIQILFVHLPSFKNTKRQKYI